MSISGGFDGASRHFEKKKRLLISIYKTFDVHYTYHAFKNMCKGIPIVAFTVLCLFIKSYNFYRFVFVINKLKKGQNCGEL